MAFSVKRFKSILNDMVNWMIANQNKLTDFNEGSIIRTFCEATGLEIEELYIRARVGFTKELKQVPFYAFDFKREGERYSTGAVVFSRPGSSGDVDILAGALISTSDGIKFETAEDGQIANGNTDSAAIVIKATKAGKTSNVPANAITVIITPITGVETVDNPSSTTGGQDQETEAEFLQRFQEKIEGLGMSNVAGLKAGAKEIEGVRSASVVEHFPPVSDYNITVYIDDGAGNATQEMIDDVEDKLLGDGTEDNPGYKAGGINLRVLAPTKVTIDVAVEVTDDGTVLQDTVKYLVEEAVSGYVNNLLIGEDMILNELRAAIMDVIGVYDIDVTDPTTNEAISATQVARAGTIVVTFT